MRTDFRRAIFSVVFWFLVEMLRNPLISKNKKTTRNLIRACGRCSLAGAVIRKGVDPRLI